MNKGSGIHICERSTEGKGVHQTSLLPWCELCLSFKANRATAARSRPPEPSLTRIHFRMFKADETRTKRRQDAGISIQLSSCVHVVRRPAHSGPNSEGVHVLGRLPNLRAFGTPCCGLQVRPRTTHFPLCLQPLLPLMKLGNPLARASRCSARSRASMLMWNISDMIIALPAL